MHEINLVELPAGRDGLKAPQRAIGMIKTALTKEILQEAMRSGVYHIVQKDSPRLEVEVATSKLMLRNCDDFFRFPLSSILNPSDVSAESEARRLSFEFTFDRAGAKDEMLAKFSAHFEPLILSSAFSDIQLIADELFTNAVFNAPYPSGGALSNSVSRADVLVQNQQLHPGRIFATIENSMFVIGCEDRYGSLDCKGLVARLVRCYENGVHRSVNLGGGGAGLGTFMVLNTCNGYYAAVEPNRRTVVCAQISIKPSHLSQMNTAKHIHICENPGI